MSTCYKCLQRLLPEMDGICLACTPKKEWSKPEEATWAYKAKGKEGCSSCQGKGLYLFQKTWIECHSCRPSQVV